MMKNVCFAALTMVAAMRYVPFVHAEPVTRVENADVAFELPGKWDAAQIEDGVEYRRGDEQVIASVYAPPDGKTGADAIVAMSVVQRMAVVQVCSAGPQVTKAVRADIPGLIAMRITSRCTNPPLVATLYAATAHERMLSFEYYDNTGKAPSLQHAAQAKKLFATVKLKPAAPTSPKR